MNRIVKVTMIDDATQPLIEKPNKLEEKGIRDSSGKFISGHPQTSQGRPKRKTLTEMIHEKLDTSEGDFTWKELVEIIITMAKGKDKDIVRELWHYTDGKPKETVDIQAKGDFNVTLKRSP